MLDRLSKPTAMMVSRIISDSVTIRAKPAFGNGMRGWFVSVMGWIFETMDHGATADNAVLLTRSGEMAAGWGRRFAMVQRTGVGGRVTLDGV
jgi:hypothetical protein